MTEISFARSFLSALDGRPIKVTSDHISDPRQLPAQVSYTLPKYPHSPPKRKRSDSTSTPTNTSSASLSVNLSTMKFPTHTLKLDGQSGSTSVFDLKNAYVKRFSVPVDKIKLLYAKKPVADSKTLGEVIGSATGDVEFSVMLMGGVVPSDSAPEENVPAAKEAPVEKQSKKEDKHVSAGPSGKELETDAFWEDLKGFLVQRLKDEGEGERLAKVFRKAAS
ncbi:hypothetical protein BT63DRAFT_478894 [Microthyrium microscopicum]|uniref:Ubiquitin-like domain-containing protein n=1 Tax=Microthyrium microscopicum TaxID=703497 RepID=A0A6A6UDM2_9PEZI|nr:hypothetical protein BT63DRAFT_478894 [Microthyrium microscopicum]